MPPRRGPRLSPARAVSSICHCGVARIATQMALAVAAGAHHRRLENKAALLERTIKGRRTIEKATQLLASERGIAQTDAYEVMRKAAMSGRTTMAEIARGYLSSTEATAQS